ncbi:MAG TPA: sigma-70 family RNA polymerase sigma factor [Thermoanaerobaculia bacterium]|jgi:RNA polymerase sigma-70 factor (ECF subfamily)|nr:sigma-70 family RNA polymerase sigma factor [Thermoanaerobaculia bacterium]
MWPRKPTPIDLRPDDRALVRRMQAGEDAAFEKFFGDNFQGLFRFALSRVDGDRDLARDLAQAAMCKGMERLDTWRGEAPLFSWLCAICRFELTAHFRKLGRRAREVELPEEGLVAGGALESLSFELGDPEHQLLRREVGRLVHVAIDNLPPHYRQVLQWKYVEGLAVNEIASRLALSAKAAESLLTRARGAFRDAFASLTAAGAGPVPAEGKP